MTAISILVKVSLLLSAAGLANALVGRRLSAAARHQLWTLTMVAVLLLPMLSSALPSWTAIRFAPPRPEPTRLVGLQEHTAGLAAVEHVDTRPAAIAPMPTTPDAQSISDRISWPMILATLYAAVVALLLARLVSGRLAIRRLATHATIVSDPEWTRVLSECAECLGLRRTVQLLRSPDHAMPMAFGIRHSAILIPAIADMWPEERRRAVLLHELAHVARHDCLTQLIAATACALYWVHPGLWWIARRLRVERELACDDRVLSAGTNAREYAGHLLEIAYALGNYRAPALAVSMASSRQLEGRMLAVLDAARNRATPALRSRLAGVAVMTILLVPIAAAGTAVVAANPADEPIAFASADPLLQADSRASSMRSERQALRAPAADAPAQAASNREVPREPQRNLPGTWQIRPARESGAVQVQLTDDDGSHGFTIPVGRLSELTSGQFTGGDGPVKFSIKRDAGTFNFEGMVRSGVGAGTYSFDPNLAFAAELTRRGYARPSPDELRPLAQADIGTAFLDELSAQGYTRPTLGELVRAGQHGVGVEFLREMGREGYRPGTLNDLVKVRDHGVSAQFIRELRAEGITNLSVDDAVRVRDHGVDARYIREMRSLGYGQMSLEEVVRARDHGVTPDYVQDLRRLGFRPSKLADVITVRDHGVTADYAAEMSRLGFKELSVEMLVRTRDHGITPDYISELRQLGYQPALEDLVAARDHGITPEYIRSLSTEGYQKIALVDLIRARDHGVTADYIKALSDQGYRKIPLDDLIRMRDHGVDGAYVSRIQTLGYKNLSVDELVRLRDQGSWAERALERVRSEFQRRFN